MPCSASRSRVSGSTAVSESHMPFGVSFEPVSEIREPPEHLRALVPRIRKRHDHVVIDLSHGIAVS